MEIDIFRQQGSFLYLSNKVIYNVGAFNPQTNTLEDINLFILGGNHQLIQKLRAKKANYLDGDWTVEDGMIVKYPVDSPFPVAESFIKMRGIIPEKPSDYKTLKVEESTMRLRDLRRYIERNLNYGLDTTGQRVSYHERVAHIFAPLIFVLLGLAFSLNPLKTQSPAKGVAFSFLVVFTYLLMSRMTVSVGKGGFIPPFIAAWAPNMLFLVIATAKINKK